MGFENGLRARKSRLPNSRPRKSQSWIIHASSSGPRSVHKRRWVSWMVSSGEWPHIPQPAQPAFPGQVTPRPTHQVLSLWGGLLAFAWGPPNLGLLPTLTQSWHHPPVTHPRLAAGEGKRWDEPDRVLRNCASVLQPGPLTRLCLQPLPSALCPCCVLQRLMACVLGLMVVS